MSSRHVKHLMKMKNKVKASTESIDDIIARETKKYKELFDKQQEEALDDALKHIQKEYDQTKELIDTLPSDQLEHFTKTFLEPNEIKVDNNIDPLASLKTDEVATAVAQENKVANKTISKADKKAKKATEKAAEKAKVQAIEKEFRDEVMDLKANTSTMDKYRLWHLRKQGLIDDTETMVAKARLSKDKELPKNIQKKITKDLDSNGTLAGAIKGNKGAAFSGILSSAMAIADYKEGRKEGKTVVESLGSAAFEFAKGEILGPWGALGLGLVKGVPKAAVSAYNEVQSVNRSMNNLQRFTPFSEAQFADTQQLATMRQSGMEMAKMANYNLQQTLMGTEAKYLHR